MEKEIFIIMQIISIVAILLSPLIAIIISKRIEERQRIRTDKMKANRNELSRFMTLTPYVVIKFCCPTNTQYECQWRV